MKWLFRGIWAYRPITGDQSNHVAPFQPIRCRRLYCRPTHQPFCCNHSAASIHASWKNGSTDGKHGFKLNEGRCKQVQYGWCNAGNGVALKLHDLYQ